MPESLDFPNQQEGEQSTSAQSEVSLVSLDRVKTDAKESPVLRSRVEELRHQRERTRGELANRLLWLIIGTAFGSFLLVSIQLISDLRRNPGSDLDTDFAGDVITLLVTTQSTLAGSAIGFYFGNKQSDGK